MICSAAGAALLFLLTILQVNIIVDLLTVRLIQRRLAVSTLFFNFLVDLPDCRFKRIAEHRVGYFVESFFDAEGIKRRCLLPG